MYFTGFHRTNFDYIWSEFLLRKCNFISNMPNIKFTSHEAVTALHGVTRHVGIFQLAKHETLSVLISGTPFIACVRFLRLSQQQPLWAFLIFEVLTPVTIRVLSCEI